MVCSGCKITLDGKNLISTLAFSLNALTVSVLKLRKKSENVCKIHLKVPYKLTEVDLAVI